MSFETFYHNLEEAGMTDPGVSVEAERERIKNNPEAPIKITTPVQQGTQPWATAQ